MSLQEQKKLELRIQKILSKALNPKDKILLAISGGPDSIFLFHQLKNFSKNLYIAHLNHQLRPNSNKDQQFIEKLHDQSKTFIKVHKFSNFSEEKGRKARYQFFNQIAKTQKIKYILTAHHSDDNLETIIFNFARGSLIKGLTGIPQIQKNIFRPLLTTSKKEIINYLDSKKIIYKIDSTNKNNKYNRNKIRNKVIPLLKEINPSLEKTIAENIPALKDLQNFIEQKAKNWLQRNQPLTTKKFQKLHPALARAIILEIHQKKIGHNQNIENIHIEEILELIAKNIGNKKKKLGELTFEIKNQTIHVQKNIN